MVLSRITREECDLGPVWPFLPIRNHKAQVTRVKIDHLFQMGNEQPNMAE
jgi:hypothetical protein